MKDLLLVAVGGALGSCLRFVIGKLLVLNFASVYITTSVINIVGSAIIGCVIGLVSRYQFSNDLVLFICTGILGGFTTFSAFSYEALNIYTEHGLVKFGLYVILTVILSIVSCAFAFRIITANA